MNEYKPAKYKIINKKYIRQMIFTKLDIDEDSNEDIQFQNNLYDDDVENLINLIQEAVSHNEKDEIHKLISSLIEELSSDEAPSIPIIQDSNIITILINLLDSDDYLDEIKRCAIRCLHKIIFKSIKLNNDEIKNIVPQIKIILMFPVSFATKYALCILVNIFSDRNEYIPALIDHFNPYDILNIFKERIYEKGFARLIAISIRKQIRPIICQLFQQYSTIDLNDDYYQVILDYFDSSIFQDEESKDDYYYYLVLQGIRGITELFSTNKIELNYLQNKSFNIFNKILEALNFFQNKFDLISEFFELLSYLIYLGADCNDEQINLFIQFIFNSISIQITDSTENEFKQFKISSFNFFNTIIEKNKLTFDKDIIDLFCDSIENDPFDIECASFSALTNSIKTANLSQIYLFLSEGVFLSIFKMIQCNDQKFIGISISSFLDLFDKSKESGLFDEFMSLLIESGMDVDEILDSECELDSLPEDLIDRFYEVVNMVKQE